MKRKRPSAGQIISELREAEVLLQQWQTAPPACRSLGATPETRYRVSARRARRVNGQIPTTQRYAKRVGARAVSPSRATSGILG
jgi:hypothetical protein